MRTLVSLLPLLCLSTQAQDAHLLEQAHQSLEAKQFETAVKLARQYDRQSPGSAEAPYVIAVARWAQVYGGLQKAKNEATPPALSASRKQELRSRWSPALSEGHAEIARALKVDPHFADALAYDNLLHRLEAELAATPAEALAYTRKADALVKQAIDAKQNHPQRKVNSAALPPPPPPPPPPPAPKR